MAAPPSLILRGGTVVDGTGAPPYVADVAVAGATIAAVGRDLPARGAREVDARGYLVTPGWVDPHTHYDAQMQWDPYVTPSTANGVTTLVIGNCAVGLAPCPKPLRGFLTDLADSVEDIPASAINEAVRWEWETFPEYMDAMERRELACDVAVLVGHSAVRTWVLGARANISDRPGGPRNDPLTPGEIEKMAKVVEEAVAAGAIGLSSSRVGLHRDPSGVLLPGSLASADELLAMGAGVVRGGGGVFELASQWSLYDDVPQLEPSKVEAYVRGEWDWLSKMATMSPDKLLVTTGLGTGMTPETARGHRPFLKQIEKVASRGGSIMATPMMRMGGLNFSLASGVHPFVPSRTFRRLSKAAGGDITALAARMAEPANRTAIVSEARAVAKERGPAAQLVGVVLGASEFVWPWSPDYEPRRDDSIRVRAKREGKSQLDVCYDVLSQPGAAHRGVLWRALYNYGTHDMEPLREMVVHKQVVPGFGDGGAHTKMLCDATTPTTMLTHWSRDRTRGEQLPLEVVVRKQTAETAQMMGLRDRGEIRPGMKADLNVIDFGKLKVLAPEFTTDLPLGAGRWVQGVDGYRMTVVSGVVTYENGAPTGALPGRVVRNPRRSGRHGGSRGSVPAGDTGTAANAVDLKEHALKLAAAKGAGFSGIQKTLNEAKL